MRIQLIDPDPGNGSPERHARVVPILATEGLPTLVLAGDIIDVPVEIGGTLPHWRKPRDGDDIGFMETKLDKDGGVESVHDLGSGLLAQVDVWAPADPVSKTVLRKPDGGDK